MKRPLKFKEAAFILLPVVALGLFAWYQQRVEQVATPRRWDGIFVSGIEIKPAKGRFQAKGLSHEIKVTIDHSQPRPGWWSAWNSQVIIDPLSDARRLIPRSANPQKVVAYGGVLTTTSIKNDKPNLKVQCRDKVVGASRSNNEIIFSHYLTLDKIPLSAGEVTFRGVYSIAGQKPIRVTRIVRKAGETARQEPDTNPYGRIVSIKAGAFSKATTIPEKGQDVLYLDFVVSRAVQGTKKAEAIIEDLELHDGRGQVLKPYQTNGFDMTWSSNTGSKSNINTGGQSIGLYLAPTLKTTNPLVVKGKVCIDEAWPIPFSVRLPNR